MPISQHNDGFLQGLTGREGTFHAKGCAAYGTQVVGGVTPGKGGTKHEGWPVFNTVHAVSATDANATPIFVPPPYAADAIMEAVDAEVPLIVCITEGVPARDMVTVWSYTNRKLRPYRGRTVRDHFAGQVQRSGSVPGNIHQEGKHGIVSRSGTLTYEAVHQCTQLGHRRRSASAAIR